MQALEVQSQSITPPPKGLWNQTREYFDELGESFNFKKYYKQLQDEVEIVLLKLKNKFDNAIENMLSLIAIFIMQSVVLPLLSLFFFVKLFQGFLKKDITEFFNDKVSDKK